MSTEQSGSKRVSPLETVFGFTHDAFRSYIDSPRFRGISNNRIYELYDRMEASPEPVVMYAAGWLLGEFITKSSKDIPNKARYDAVQEASSLWSHAREVTRFRLDKARSDRDRKMTEEYYALDLQIGFAQAHLPALRAIGTRITTGETKQELLDETHENLMEFSSELLTKRNNSKNEQQVNNVLAGAMSETIVSTLIHRANDHDLIAAPSSIRQQGLQRSSLRTDIIVHDFSGADYIKVPLQVKTKHNLSNNTYSNTLLVHVLPYLGFSGTKTPTEILAFLQEEYQGGAKRTEEERDIFNQKSMEVDQMTGWLISKIYNFRTEKTRFVMPEDYYIPEV